MISLGVFTVLISGIVAWLVTPAVIWAARRIGAVDHPSARKVHDSPIPRIGGVAVLAGTLAGLVFAGYATGYMLKLPQTTMLWVVVGGSALAMFGLGLFDDIRGLSFRTKFAVQILAAVVVWFGGFRIEVLSFPVGEGAVELGFLSLPITVLWIVGVTNAINLIDGLDGLAAGAALIATAGVAVIAIQRDYYSVTGMSAAMAGALAGFLVYNFNPAKIFLGDSGSLFLGFMLAVMSIRSSQKSSTAVAVLTPLLILGLPLLDTSLAIFRRFYRVGYRGLIQEKQVSYVVKNAHRVFLPDRGHVHHRLLATGLSHRSTVLVLYIAVVFLAFAALAISIWNSLPLAGVLVTALCVLAAGFVLFVKIRARRRAASSSTGGVEPVQRAVEVGRLVRPRGLGHR